MNVNNENKDGGGGDSEDEDENGDCVLAGAGLCSEKPIGKCG